MIGLLPLIAAGLVLVLPEGRWMPWVHRAVAALTAGALGAMGGVMPMVPALVGLAAAFLTVGRAAMAAELGLLGALVIAAALPAGLAWAGPGLVLGAAVLAIGVNDVRAAARLAVPGAVGWALGVLGLILPGRGAQAVALVGASILAAVGPGLVWLPGAIAGAGRGVAMLVVAGVLPLGMRGLEGGGAVVVAGGALGVILAALGRDRARIGWVAVAVAGLAAMAIGAGQARLGAAVSQLGGVTLAAVLASPSARVGRLALAGVLPIGLLPGLWAVALALSGEWPWLLAVVAAAWGVIALSLMRGGKGDGTGWRMEAPGWGLLALAGVLGALP